MVLLCPLGPPPSMSPDLAPLAQLLLAITEEGVVSLRCSKYTGERAAAREEAAGGGGGTTEQREADGARRAGGDTGRKHKNCIGV